MPYSDVIQGGRAGFCPNLMCQKEGGRGRLKKLLKHTVLHKFNIEDGNYGKSTSSVSYEMLVGGV